MRDRRLQTLLLLVAVLIPSMVTSAQTQVDPPEPGKNVRIELVIGEPGESGQALREYTFLARDKAGRAELLMGWRIPIPTSQTTDGEDGTPKTSYVYQNVGVTVRIEVNILPKDRIRIHGHIEASGSTEGPRSLQNQTDLPIIGTFQQGLDVILRDGKLTQLAEVPDPDGGRLSLKMTATVVD